MANPSNFSDLYKSQSTRSNEKRQSERRIELLEKQKQKRSDFIDNLRCIDPSKKTIFRESKSSKQIFKLQLSEWLHETPDDLSKWYIRPCPKGQRCLIIATNGKTCMYSKYGAFVKQFSSILPGGCRSKRDDLTVLDCVHAPNEKIMFILDVIVYKNFDLSECEADFRLYWIESKVCDDNLNEINKQNQYAFQMIGKTDCNDFESFNRLVSTFPIWPNDTPRLDGFLFYHKESAYVQGRTPLVGWLFSFMLPEVFNLPMLNIDYLNEKPSDYKDFKTFIEEFDRKQKMNKKYRRKSRSVPMDTIDTNNEFDNDIVNDTKELELEDIDDMY